MNDAFADLLEKLCIALGRSCNSATLGHLLEVFEQMTIEDYRRLVHDRFKGRFVLLPTTRPRNCPEEVWVQFKALLPKIRRCDLDHGDRS